MHKAIQVFIVLIAGFLAVLFFVSFGDKEERKTDALKLDANIPQVIEPIDLDGTFDFAGERLPMKNFDVRERLDRELLVNTYWHSSTILNIKNSYRYFPMMDKILEEHGVPTDFKYASVAESSLRNETSPAGARGFWQFMKLSAGEFGLEVNSEVDERFHIEKSTVAAAKLIKQYKERFGNWTLAAAAYNVGPTKLAKNMEVQRAKSYYDLNLNAETNRYIFRLVAIKEIIKDPRNFGFYIDEDKTYPPMGRYKTIEVSKSVANWGDFAKEHGTTYRMLKVYNPWLIDSKLTNKSGKTYEIKVPK